MAGTLLKNLEFNIVELHESAEEQLQQLGGMVALATCNCCTCCCCCEGSGEEEPLL